MSKTYYINKDNRNLTSTWSKNYYIKKRIMYSGSWKTCTYAEEKEDDLIILNQLRGDKTIFIEDNACEILDSNYIKDKKNKISYRKLWSYLPPQIIEILYQTLMREYFDEKVMMMEVPRPRGQHGTWFGETSPRGYKLGCGTELIDRPQPRFNLDQKTWFTDDSYDGQMTAAHPWYTGLEQKESGKWGYPAKKSKRFKPDRTGAVYKYNKEQQIRGWHRDAVKDTCVCYKKNGERCGKKCMTNGWSLNKPFAEIMGFELRCCGTHKRVLDKMTPDELKDEIAKIMLDMGYVEKHGIWCVARGEKVKRIGSIFWDDGPRCLELNR